MNIEAQKRFLLRFCYAAVILAVTIFLCRYALPVLAPFVAALLVSLLLRPVVRLLHERCRVHKGVAAAVTVLLFYSLLGLALGLLSVKLFASAKAFVLNLPELYNTVVEPLLEAFSEELERFVARSTRRRSAPSAACSRAPELRLNRRCSASPAGRSPCSAALRSPCPAGCSTRSS